MYSAMPLDDAVLFLTDFYTKPRVVMSHLSYFLPILDEASLIRLAEYFSPARPAIAAILNAYVRALL